MAIDPFAAASFVFGLFGKKKKPKVPAPDPAIGDYGRQLLADYKTYGRPALQQLATQSTAFGGNALNSPRYVQRKNYLQGQLAQQGSALSGALERSLQQRGISSPGTVSGALSGVASGQMRALGQGLYDISQDAYDRQDALDNALVALTQSMGQQGASTLGNLHGQQLNTYQAQNAAQSESDNSFVNTLATALYFLLKGGGKKPASAGNLPLSKDLMGGFRLQAPQEDLANPYRLRLPPR
jgi:hypothetical protein